MTPGEWIAFCTLGILVLTTTIGFGIRGSRRLSDMELAFQRSLTDVCKTAASDKAEIMQSIAGLNNSFLTNMNIRTDGFYEKVAEVQAALSRHELYSEREFISKDTFNLVIERQSLERKEMRQEIMKTLGELATQVSDIKKRGE